MVEKKLIALGLICVVLSVGVFGVVIINSRPFFEKLPYFMRFNLLFSIIYSLPALPWPLLPLQSS